jgi:hypothetical protein
MLAALDSDRREHSRSIPYSQRLSNGNWEDPDISRRE